MPTKTARNANQKYFDGLIQIDLSRCHVRRSVGTPSPEASAPVRRKRPRRSVGTPSACPPKHHSKSETETENRNRKPPLSRVRARVRVSASAVLLYTFFFFLCNAYAMRVHCVCIAYAYRRHAIRLSACRRKRSAWRPCADYSRRARNRRPSVRHSRQPFASRPPRLSVNTPKTPLQAVGTPSAPV